MSAAHCCIYYAQAIVSDQHAFTAPIGYLYLHACGTGVQGSLRELFHHRGGAVVDLSRGDLLSYQRIEYRHLTQKDLRKRRSHGDSTRRLVAEHAGLCTVPLGGVF